MELVNLKVKRDIRQAFKVRSARKGITLYEEVESFLRSKLTEEGDLPIERD